MGFFSFLKPLVDIAVPLIGQFVGLPQVAETAEKITVAKELGKALAPAAPTTAAQMQLLQTGVTGACPTQGTLRRRTIVETFDPANNVVCKRETFKGAPAVMQSDVAAANRLNRALRRLNKKQPKRLVRESPITTLKNEVVESALRRARDPCPPGSSDNR